MSASLQCPACAAPFSADELRDAQSVLVCRHCGGMFDPQRLLGQPRLAQVPRRPMPSHLEVHRGRDTLSVSWRWWSPRYLFLGVFALFWNGFLFTWYSLLLDGAHEMDAMLLPMLLFPLIHVGVGLGLTYLTIASFFNRTHVTANRRGALSITHGPFPWYPSPSVPASELSQLYVVRNEQRTKNGTTITYELRALRAHDQSLLLLRGLDDAEVARWLEQEIEQTLGILDAPVAGQLHD